MEALAPLVAWLNTQAPPALAGFIGGVAAVLAWNYVSRRRGRDRCAFCGGRLAGNCRHVMANGQG